MTLAQSWNKAWQAGKTLSCGTRYNAPYVLGSEIFDQLGVIERDAHSLRQVFDSYPEWVNARIRSALNREHFTSPQREDALNNLEVTDDDFAKRGAALTDLLVRRVTPSLAVGLLRCLPRKTTGTRIFTDEHGLLGTWKSQSSL